MILLIMNLFGFSYSHLYKTSSNLWYLLNDYNHSILKPIWKSWKWHQITSDWWAFLLSWYEEPKTTGLGFPQAIYLTQTASFFFATIYLYLWQVLYSDNRQSYIWYSYFSVMTLFHVLYLVIWNSPVI